jgi:hypothetical protein
LGIVTHTKGDGILVQLNWLYYIVTTARRLLSFGNFLYGIGIYGTPSAGDDV